jgi:hypothetical protein
MPTVDDMINDLNGSKVYSKLDLNNGYHQLELALESRYITTFCTRIGHPRYIGIPFLVSSRNGFAMVDKSLMNLLLLQICIRNILGYLYWK